MGEFKISSYGDVEEYYKKYYDRMPCSNRTFNHIIHSKLSITKNIIFTKSINAKNDVLLEVGIGSGNHFSYENFSTYIGIDLSLTNLELTKKKHGQNLQEDAALDLINGDGLNLPLKSDYFPFIVMTCLAHHVSDVERLFSELLRVSRKDSESIIRIMLPTDPGVLFRIVRQLTQVPWARKLGFKGYKLYIARDHRNHFGSIREIAKWTYRNHVIKFKYFPFLIPLYDINTHVFCEITFE